MIRTVIRNPIEAWPQLIYETPFYRSRLAGQDTLFVMEPDLVREVLVDKAESFHKAEALTRALGPALGHGLLTADGERWRWQRRAASPTFRHERLLGFLPAMIGAAEHVRDRWLRANGGRVELAHEMMQLTFAIIVETMLSGREGIDADRVEQAITEYLETTSWPVALSMLKAPRWTPYPGRWRAARAGRYLRGEVLRVVRGRRADPRRREDLIGLLLEAPDPETGRTMSDEELTDNLLTFIAAGHETTALALTWTFYLLDLHPEVRDRALAEIEAVMGDGGVRPDRVPALAYLRQIVSEAMRLYPPAPIVVRDAVEPVAIGSHILPAGATVYVPVYAIHRHRSLWKEPDRFDPDRFGPEAAKARHRYAYLPFGAGPRICIGMNFALLEAVAILAVLLPAVDLARETDSDPGLKLRITLRPAGGLPMRVRARERRG